MIQLFTMPVPPSDTSADLPYYQAFIHTMHAMGSPFEEDVITAQALAEKLHLAINHTARITQTSPAHIARLLVEYGLCAPPAAFPDSFVEYVEATNQPRYDRRSPVEYPQMKALKNFWHSLSSGLMQATA